MADVWLQSTNDALVHVLRRYTNRFATDEAVSERERE